MLAKTVFLCAMFSLSQSHQLDEQSLSHWSDYIRPKASELNFEDAEWKPTFWEAVVEAQKSGKPILLWAMNGHPLACT